MYGPPPSWGGVEGLGLSVFPFSGTRCPCTSLPNPTAEALEESPCTCAHPAKNLCTSNSKKTLTQDYYIWSRNINLDLPLALSPRGSKDPSTRALGPKYYNINGIWALKPHYLGPWTLMNALMAEDPAQKRPRLTSICPRMPNSTKR